MCRSCAWHWQQPGPVQDRPRVALSRGVAMQHGIDVSGLDIPQFEQSQARVRGTTAFWLLPAFRP
ncbi:hypothetical protein GW15_0200725 [Xanthomonas axonopodis pv. vasculorum]|uniref:Uncharacterized protein n=1 Tax=Xanthomonas axonopodis pv. vasculorum TaxID=325777 RepID=A0A098Q2M5_9XANT|nr:hypothetical protein GW15_0200725 [Xanthomonas axonopodis pv. vasculorum]